MSIITSGLPQRNCKKSYHQRHDSEELHVFEAATYFSGANYTHQKISRSGGRISLDNIPMTRNSNIQAQAQKYDQVVLDKITTKEKKYKQPNSPGGRLASFLNSLFSQNSSKNKKSKSCSIIGEDNESPSGRRKRSSISHFGSANISNNMSSSKYSSSSSGFRTPPYSNSTCTKNLKKLVDHNKPQDGQVPSVSNNNSIMRCFASQKEDIRKMNAYHNNAWLDDDDKFKFSTTTSTSNNSGFWSEKCKMFGNGFLDHQSSSRKDLRNSINEMDDGAESDSSSDLFELQINYDLGCCYSSGLPVYETTHMDNIKRGAPITSCAI